MTRKCPKNNCPHVYLRLTKEVTTLKKEVICLKCQHFWSSAAKYVQSIPVGESEELASLKEIAEDLHKKYEVKDVYDFPILVKRTKEEQAEWEKIKPQLDKALKEKPDIFVSPAPELTPEDIEQMKREGVEFKAFFAGEKAYTHTLAKEKKKERNVPKPHRKRAIVVKKSRTKDRPRVVDGCLERDKEKKEFKGEFKIEDISTKVVKVMPHAPLTKKPVIKRKKWFKPWTWRH